MRKLLAAALLSCAVLAPAQTKRPMTFADLMAMKRVSDPQVSPSGKWVLFSVTEVSLEKNSKVNHLWIVPLDGSAKERQVTRGSGEANGRFSPDGKWVMFSSGGQVAIAPFDDAKGAVGKEHAVTSLETGADGAIWAPDSRHIVFTSSVYPECEADSSGKLVQPQTGAEAAFRPPSPAPTHAGFSPGPLRDNAEAKCNADRDAAEAKDPVKARIFDGLLYRHWNAYTGPQHSHIFYGSVDPKDAPPTDITPASVVGDHEAPTFSLGGPLGYAISPDGREIAYEVNLDKVPAESTNNDIFTLAVGADPGTAKKVSTSPGSDDGPQYSPDGKWLAWRSQARNGYESDKIDLVVMDRATGKMKKLVRPVYTAKEGQVVFDDWVDEFSWSSDSRAIAITSSSHGEEPVYLLSIDEMAPGINRQTILASGAEFSEVRLLAGISDSKISFVAVSTSVDQPARLVWIRKSTVVETRAARFMEAPSRGPVEKLEVRTLSRLNEPLVSELSLSKLEPFWFAGANGTKVQGFLVKPPNFDPAKKYPVKFLIHGGPQGAWGDAWSYRWNPELMAASGYVVVMVNPRGSTGYGQKFLEQVSGDWGGRAYEDLMKGLDYAEQHYSFIDKDRECALGASYGGFMADWVLTHTNRFKCIVTHDGMSDPTAAFGTTEELWFNEWEFRPLAGPTKNVSSRPKAAGRSGETPAFAPAKSSGAPFVTAPSSRVGNEEAVVEQAHPSHPWDFYGKPDSENPYVKWSPMRFIKDAHTPTLIVHGQLDYRLDVSQGMELFTALQLLGVPSKMLYFPDEGHWVLKPRNAELWNATVSDWCDRWMGMGKYASVGPARNSAAAPVHTTSTK